MAIRKQVLVNEQYYHIYNRSIAKFIIFNDAADFDRMYKLIDLCRFDNFQYKLSQFIDLDLNTQKVVINSLASEKDILVEIVAYCLMPTHIHLLLKQIKNDGIAKYTGRVLNAFSRYFNERHARNGPLWSGRFKNVLVNKDEQLLHLTRYIHLNPVSAGLVSKPEKWQYSSYNEYVTNKYDNRLCDYTNLFGLNSNQYKKFVNDGKSYQKSLALIKHMVIENYTG